MAIRDQRIDIGYGVEKVRRVVFDYRSNPEAKLQTGYVRYDSDRVPVWRPYEPREPGHDALWQSGLWRNIYVLKTRWNRSDRSLSYQTTDHSVGGLIIALPAVDVVPSHLLLVHLEGLQGT